MQIKIFLMISERFHALTATQEIVKLMIWIDRFSQFSEETWLLYVMNRLNLGFYNRGLTGLGRHEGESLIT